MKHQVSRAVLAQAIVDLLTKGVSSERVASSVAEYIAFTGRTSEIESILRHVDNRIATLYGRREVQVTSAHRLSDDLREKVRQLFSDELAIRLHEELDPTLVGGIRLRAQDYMLDVSVTSKLRMMKQRIKMRRT